MLDSNTNIQILMAGPNSKYKNKLKALSSKYKLDNNIYWTDIILKDLKWGAISASQGMVLSSHGENFGVSIVESLSCSKPVLTTNKVNIHKEITKYKAGFISKNNTSSYLTILRKFNSLNKNQLKKLSKNSLRCFNDNFNLNSNRNNLSYLLQGKND